MQAPPAAIVAEIDLHCHILPNWDDGPQSVEESLRMAARAAATGLKTIAVTPHVGRSFAHSAEHEDADIPAATAVLQSQIRAHGIDITLVSGAEITLASPDLAERIGAEPWLTLGGYGRYTLVEAPFAQWPVYAPQLIQQIVAQGVIPIVAHPERYPEVQRDIRIMEQVVAMGALLQVTARSLLGNDNRKAFQTTRKLIDAGLVALVASDVHAAKGVLPCEVVGKLIAAVGETAARTILVENPARVLQGEWAEAPYVEAPSEQGTKWSLKRLVSLARQ